MLLKILYRWIKDSILTTQIFKDNKLSEVQKAFWSAHQLAMSKHKDMRGMRWTPFVIRIALRIQMMTGSAGYDALRKICFLPSQRRLYDFTHFSEVSEGPQKAILDIIQNVMKDKYKEIHQQYFNLSVTNKLK